MQAPSSQDTFEIFPWNTNFETGIPLLDLQHRELIDLLNLLVSQLANQAEQATLNTTFEQLKKYSIVHFSTEEEIWSQYFEGDPWEQWHKNSHGDFVAEIIKIKEEEELTKPLDEVLEKIVRFLTHWLTYHILEADKRMAKVVLALPEAHTLSAAQACAEAEMTDSTRNMIATTMKMYDELANRNVRLSREIRIRQQIEEELRMARAKAEAASLAKTHFLTNVSHEIRTPLNAILGLVKLMNLEHQDPAQHAQFDKLEQASKQLLDTLNNVLDLSRIEMGKVQLEEKPLDIGTLLANVSSLLADSATEKGLLLTVTHEPIQDDLLGDSARLQQILLNLTRNAIKFSEQGMINLRVQKLEDSYDDVLLRFEVQDTGIGIAPEQLQRLFLPFEQGNNAPDRRHGGAGTGLAICKRLAELMQGSIGVESTLGQGSSFWFMVRLRKDFPVTNDEVTELAPAEVIELLQQRYAGCRVLLVEDDEFNQEISKIMLERVGMQVDCALNGIEALRMNEATRYDLIVMDVQMPVMDGLEATRKIRQTPNGRHVPIIACTANALAEDRERCLDAGMDDYLTKPVMPELLNATLLRWLQHACSLHSQHRLDPAAQ